MQDFLRVELGRTEFGLCPEDGAVISAAIVRLADGTASIEGVRATETEPAVFVEEAFGPQSVSRCDARTLQSLIEAVPATRECIYGNGACDPCLVWSLTVDDDEATWSGCCELDGLLEYTDSFLAIVEAILELGSADP